MEFKGPFKIVRRLIRTSAESDKRVTKPSAAESRLAILHEINLAVTSTLDLRGVLTVLMKKIDNFLPYTAVLIWLKNQESGQLERAACWNLDEAAWKGRKLRDTPALVKAAITTRAPVVAYNVQTDPRTLDPEFYRKQGLISYLGVPLLVKAEVLGVLVFLTREERHFSDEEMEFLSTLAGQAAIAIYNSQLYEAIDASKKELERANRRLERLLGDLSSLYAALTPLAPADSLDQMLDRIIGRLMESTVADAALVRVQDKVTGTFICACQRGFPDYFLESARAKSAGSAVGKVFDSGEPIIVPDVATDPRLEGKIQLQAGFHSCALLPLKVRNELRGIVHLASRNPGHFEEEQKDHLMAVVRQMGIAIENRELFDEINTSRLELEKANRDLKKQEETQELLKELSQDITSLDIDNLLKKLTERVRKSLKVDICDVRVIEHGAARNAGVSGIEAERILSGNTGTGRWKWFLENRRPLVIPDVAYWTGFMPLGETTLGLGVSGYLGVPLMSRSGEVIGVLRALNHRPKNFSQEEIALLQQLANGAAIALENARLLDQTKKQATELEQAGKMQADFTAMMIHDLRAPIMNMMGTAEMMADGLFGPVNEEQRNWLLKLLANGRSLADLISNYLDLSKIEAGCMTINKEDLDLAELIRNSIENYLPLARNRKISIAGAVHPVFSRIKADPRRLNQVLSNLLSNAVKFTGNGGQIEVGADHVNGAQIRVWVKDTGVGIASEEIGGLFEKYRQLASGKISKHKGTGLGLVICKTIVEAHGGQIWVESEQGRGTTFFFSLPVVP